MSPPKRLTFPTQRKGDPLNRATVTSTSLEGTDAPIQSATNALVRTHGLTLGQLAWIVERFKDWTDSTDVPEDAVDRETMLTNVMIYWLNGTAGSSARYSKEGAATWGQPSTPSTVPTAVAVLPHDIGSPVRRIAEHTDNIIRWVEFERGGHFAAMEEPDLIVADLRDALKSFR